MRFDLITIFPEFFAGPLGHGIIRRAREAGIIETHVHDLRDWTHDRHRTVDDRPFGGGEGMLLKSEPLFEAVESLVGKQEGRPEALGSTASTTAVVLLSASGKLFRQETARRFAQLKRIVLLCGRYEGVDERVAEHLATDEISIGDFVLSGGELPAALVLDAVTRLLPGALGNEDSSMNESFSAEVCSPPLQRRGSSGQISTTHAPEGAGYTLLDCPHYTRPAEFRGWAVPEILLSGNHEDIRMWRRKMALAKTLRNRPELLAGASLSDEDARLLAELRKEGLC
jgi:tRNA (guanine37-N1)-methyltransferase